MTSEQSRSPEVEHDPPGNIAQAQLESIPIFPTSLLRSINAKDLGIGKVRVLLKLTSNIDSSPEAKSFLSLDKRKKQVTIHDYGSRVQQGSTNGSENSPPNLASPERRPGVSAPKMFAFDGVFSPDDSVAELCTCTLLDPLRAAATGSVGCVLVYGYPKLGKTRTIIGERRRPDAVAGKRESNMIAGVLPTALAWLLLCLTEMKRTSKNRSYSVHLSAVEILAAQGNEPRDLLRMSSGESGRNPSEATTVEIPDVNAGLSTIDRALARRTWAPTAHALFTLHVKIQEKADNGSLVAEEQGRLHILDLGGGDTQGRTGLSASAVGHILVAIFNGSKHLPHRENPLTSLVQKCLSSLTCQTTVIAHISAGTSHVPETMTTIQLSSRIHRLRRMKIKVPGASGSGGSSGEDSKVVRMLGMETTLLSSDVDPSSSEQSCDTVIYLGPARDDATDGEHPPVDIPPVSEGGKLKCPIATMKEKMTAPSKEKTVERDKRGHSTNKPVAHTPSPDALRGFGAPVTSSLPGTPRRHHPIGQKQFFQPPLIPAQFQEALVVHGTPSRAHNRQSRYVTIEQFQNVNGSYQKSAVLQHPSRRNYASSKESSGYASRNEELWVDWPKPASRNPRRATEMLELRQLKSMPSVNRHPDDKSRRYGYMDDHKKSMIEQWVETQTMQLRAQPPEFLHGAASCSTASERGSWLDSADYASEKSRRKRDSSSPDGRRRRQHNDSKSSRQRHRRDKASSCRRYEKRDERCSSGYVDSSCCQDPDDLPTCGQSCKPAKRNCCHGCCGCCSRHVARCSMTQHVSTETPNHALETTKPISVVSPKVKVETTFPARDNAAILVHELGSGTATTNVKRPEQPSPPSFRDNGTTDEMSFGSFSIAVRDGDGDGSVDGGAESVDYACSSNDVLETIEVPEREEPVPMQDMSVQVTEQDIAFCLGLENPLPESDQEGPLESPCGQYGPMSPSAAHFSTMALFEAHIDLPDHTQLSDDLSHSWRDDYFAKRFPLPPAMPQLTKTTAFRPILLDPFGKTPFSPDGFRSDDRRAQSEQRLSSCSFQDCHKFSSPKTVTPVSNEHPGFSLCEQGAQFDTELRDKLSRLYSKLRHPDGASNPNIFSRSGESPEKPNLSSACSEPDRNKSQGKIIFSSDLLLGPRTVIGQDSPADLLKSPFIVPKKELDQPRMVAPDKFLVTKLTSSRSLDRPPPCFLATTDTGTRQKTSRRKTTSHHHRTLRGNKNKGPVQPHGESSGYESIVRDSDCSSVASSHDGSDQDDGPQAAGVEKAGLELVQYDDEDIAKMERRADLCLDVMRRFAELRKRQDFLKKELAAAKQRLSIPKDRWSYDLHVADQLDSRPDSDLVEALEQETKILEKRVVACRSHLLLVTCFDSSATPLKEE